MTTTYELDGARFETLEGFYEEVSRVLIPGHGWGRNLDAFNDVLRGGYGTPEDGFRIVWCNSSKSKQDLGYSETVKQLQLRLDRCHPGNRETVAAELEAARRGVGQSVFDWLVEMIRNHENLELVLS